MDMPPRSAGDIASSIAEIRAAARRAQFRLVEYFLDLALMEARRAAADGPTWWHDGRPA